MEPTKFNTITSEDWLRSILRSRSEPNLLYEKIKSMKLHPINPTPGLSHPFMITFEPYRTETGDSFRCKTQDLVIGYLHKHEEAYRFFPNHYYGACYSAEVLKEIAFKLTDLNAPPQTFTD